jgi:hypothetical protein
MTLKALSNLTINNFGTGTTGLNCYVFIGGNGNSRGINIWNGTLTYNVCNISTPISVNNSQFFTLCVHNASTNYAYNYSSQSVNVTRTNVMFTNVGWNDDGIVANVIVAIKNITTQKETQITTETIYPLNNATLFKNKIVPFQCSAFSQSGYIQNISLWTNSTGSFALNQSNDTSALSIYNITQIFNLAFPTETDLILWNCKACSTNVCSFSSINNSLNFNLFFENSITYNQFANTGSYESFAINLSYDTTTYTGISVNLVYNNTNYSTTQVGSAGTYVFTSNFNLPVVTTTTNKTFYFQIILSNSTGFTYYNSTSNIQTINLMGIDNCSIYNKTILNFTMVDEESLEVINGTIEFLAKIYSFGNNSLIAFYNKTIPYETYKNASICISNVTSSYSLFYTIKHYGNSSYFKKYRN